MDRVRGGLGAAGRTALWAALALAWASPPSRADILVLTSQGCSNQALLDATLRGHFDLAEDVRGTKDVALGYVPYGEQATASARLEASLEGASTRATGHGISASVRGKLAGMILRNATGVLPVG